MTREDSLNMKKTAGLRELIERPEILVAPGAYDALSAKLIEAAGFDAVYMTGFGTAAGIFGLPDIGLLTMTEMVENAGRIANSVEIPVIADADTGYGNHLNVIRTVEEYERAGVAGIQIEDQVSPKRCGHMEGQKIIPIPEMVAKLRAAVKVRQNRETVIIARTDAISAAGFDDAIERGNIYRDAGADLLFIEAPRTEDQLQKIPKLINGPVLVNIAPKTPFMHVSKYEEFGYAMAIYPAITLTAAYGSIKDKLKALREQGMTEDDGHGDVPFEELVEFLGLSRYRNLEAKALSGQPEDKPE
jgi:2-methylisocitrate lyase-like PEP mutase family enzyme